ncbi:hypothetical protein [Acidithiobacillus ferriphilus]|uniref:hypothetical protein n=1 Tax=Acidithiobacillus ferriphilus TaxID=1689834 RepID=UPI001C062A91|nr:hypothetical protein [Acidithiobacillus ferriphilus]
MKGIPDRLLSNLNPMQRCSVIFSALGRGDTTEASRLADTAPTGTYTAADFYNPFITAMLVSGLARGDIEHQAGEEWHSRCLWLALVHKGGMDDETVDALWDAGTLCRNRTGSLWSAFAQVMTDAGLDPDEVMRSMGGLSKLAQESVDACTEAEPDPDAVALYAAMLKP